jgi:tRNA (mo5U34)-methyltransferase
MSRRMPSMLSPEAAETLLKREDILWHQRFELSPGRFTPGVSDVEELLGRTGVPADLSGASVLDIGTTNGGTAFALERRGAERVVATDIYDGDRFGFNTIRDALGSRAEFRTMSVYEIAQSLDETFDVVIFWGVLYHLRHPLLALDNVRGVTRGQAYIETAVCDYETAASSDLPLARFYRRDELAGDGSNWFAPNVAALQDWCRSCGLEPEEISSWPEGQPNRALLSTRAIEGVAEYQTISYERPLRCSVELDFGRPSAA